MRETIEELMKRVRRLAEAFAGTGDRREREEQEEQTPETKASRRVRERREIGRLRRSRREPEEVRESTSPRRADWVETLRRGLENEAQETKRTWPEREEIRTRRRSRGEATPLRQEAGERELTEETAAPDRTGQGGDAGEYGFGDGTDPSRYFYSEDYLERLSGYLETDARRYGPRNMD